MDAAGHQLPAAAGGAVGKLEASTATAFLDATPLAVGRTPHSPAASHGRRQPPPTVIRAARHAVTSSSSWRLRYRDFVPPDFGKPRDSKTAASAADSWQYQFQ